MFGNIKIDDNTSITRHNNFQNFIQALMLLFRLVKIFLRIAIHTVKILMTFRVRTDAPPEKHGLPLCCRASRAENANQYILRWRLIRPKLAAPTSLFLTSCHLYFFARSWCIRVKIKKIKIKAIIILLTPLYFFRC